MMSLFSLMSATHPLPFPQSLWAWTGGEHCQSNAVMVGFLLSNLEVAESFQLASARLRLGVVQGSHGLRADMLSSWSWFLRKYGKRGGLHSSDSKVVHGF